jgi:SWI/SNF-related matrix-associated actin-dependent regulator 1 of chromatin subfamily A
VLKELPKKLISIVPMAIDNRAEYTEAEDNFIEYVEKKIDSDLKKLSAHIATEVEKFNKVHDTDYGFAVSQDNENEYKKQRIESISKAPVLVQIEYLKQLAVKGKMKQIMEWIDNFIESGEKLVIFATHRNIIDTLYAKYQSIAVKLYGGMTPKQRQDAVDLFQKDLKVKLFIGNIDSAGVGITLTAASNVAMIELPWNPGKLVQASDRVHRITQTKQVTIYNLIAVNTIEEKLVELLHEKQEIIEQVLDGKLNSQTNILAELINSYTNQKSKV